MIPLDPARRGRAMGLWQWTGERLGVLGGGPRLRRAPREVMSGGGSSYTDNSVVANFHADFGSNTASDYSLERKIKRWVSDAINNLLESGERKGTKCFAFCPFSLSDIWILHEKDSLFQSGSARHVNERVGLHKIITARPARPWVTA